MELMDEVERRRFLDTMGADSDFRAAVRRELLTEELLSLPQTATKLVEVVTQRGEDIAALTATVKTLVDVVAEQGRDISSLGTAVAGLVEVVGEHGRDISALGAGFTAVDARFDRVNADIIELRTDMKTGFTAVDARFDQVNAQIRDITDQLAS